MAVVFHIVFAHAYTEKVRVTYKDFVGAGVPYPRNITIHAGIQHVSHKVGAALPSHSQIPMVVFTLVFVTTMICLLIIHFVIITH